MKQSNQIIFILIIKLYISTQSFHFIIIFFKFHPFPLTCCQRFTKECIVSPCSNKFYSYGRKHECINAKYFCTIPLCQKAARYPALYLQQLYLIFIGCQGQLWQNVKQTLTQIFFQLVSECPKLKPISYVLFSFGFS